MPTLKRIVSTVTFNEVGKSEAEVEELECKVRSLVDQEQEARRKFPISSYASRTSIEEAQQQLDGLRVKREATAAELSLAREKLAAAIDAEKAERAREQERTFTAHSGLSIVELEARLTAASDELRTLADEQHELNLQSNRANADHQAISKKLSSLFERRAHLQALTNDLEGRITAKHRETALAAAATEPNTGPSLEDIRRRRTELQSEIEGVEAIRNQLALQAARLRDQIGEPLSLIEVGPSIESNTALRHELASCKQALEQLNEELDGRREEVRYLQIEENAILDRQRAEAANKLLPAVADAVFKLQEALEAFEQARGGAGVVGTPSRTLAQVVAQIIGQWRVSRPELLR